MRRDAPVVEENELAETIASPQLPTGNEETEDQKVTDRKGLGALNLGFVQQNPDLFKAMILHVPVEARPADVVAKDEAQEELEGQNKEIFSDGTEILVGIFVVVFLIVLLINIFGPKKSTKQRGKRRKSVSSEISEASFRAPSKKSSVGSMPRQPSPSISVSEDVENPPRRKKKMPRP